MGAEVKTLALCGSVGQLVDQSVDPGAVLGVATLITPAHALTSAHLVFKYASYLQSLALAFPGKSALLAVAAVEFHPQFDLEKALAVRKRSFFEAAAILPLLPHNLALLSLGKSVADISAEMRAELDQWLSFSLPE